MKWMHERVGSQSGQGTESEARWGTGRGLSGCEATALPGRVVSRDYFRGLLGRWPCWIGRRVARGWEGWDRLIGSCRSAGVVRGLRLGWWLWGMMGTIALAIGFRERGRHQGTWVQGWLQGLGSGWQERTATEQMERLEGENWVSVCLVVCGNFLNVPFMVGRTKKQSQAIYGNSSVVHIIFSLWNVEARGMLRLMNECVFYLKTWV